jgi:hypothetical protein
MTLAADNMSFLARNARFATRPVIARQVVPSRAFTISSVRALKEDDRRMFIASRFQIEPHTDEICLE